MAMQKTHFDAKLEVLLGERGQSADRAVRHKELAALRDQMVTQISKAVLASVSAEISAAKRLAQEAFDARGNGGEALVPDEANQDILDAQDEAGAAAQQASAPIVPSQIKGVLEEASYAAGLVPPLVVSTLPTTGNFAGRLAFLTTDGKLYRYNGGWTRAVDGADLIANSILAGSFQAGAVRAEDLAADSVLARHIAIGDFTNLVPGGDLRDIGDWTFSSPGYYTLNAPSQAATAQDSFGELVFTPIAGGVSGWVRARSKPFPIKPTDNIRASFQGWRSVIGSFWFQARVNFYDRAGTEITSTIIATRTDADPAVTTPFAVNVAVPAGTVAGAFDFIADNSVTNVPIRFAAPMVRLRNGGELIVEGAITSDKLTIGNRAITLTGIQFEHNKPVANSVAWTAGSVRYIDDDGAIATASVTGGNAAWSSGVLYIYWVKGAGTLSATTAQATAFGANNVVLATYQGGTLLDADYGRTIIDGSDIKTGTITASQLVDTAALITKDAQIGNLIVDTIKLKDGAVSVFNVTGSATTATNNSASFTTVDTFSLSMGTSAYAQAVIGIYSFTLSTTPNNYPSNFTVEVYIAGNLVAEITKDTLNANPNVRRYTVALSRPAIGAASFNVTAGIRNAGGYGLINTNLWAIAEKK